MKACLTIINVCFKRIAVLLVAALCVANPSTVSATSAPQGSGVSPALQSMPAKLTDLETLRYIASHGDLIAAFGTDIEKGRKHYEQYGFNEGRRITFDPLRYIASHSDLITAFGLSEDQATRHYINYGFKEQRSTTLFDAGNYLARYADLRSAFGRDFVAATKHYIQWGFAEGRSFAPLFDVELVFSLDKDAVPAGGTVTLSWSAKHSTGCSASGSWSGERATSGSLSLTVNSPGRFEYILECRGERASAKREVMLAVTFPVLPTSYENKNSIAFDKTQVPNLHELRIKTQPEERGGNDRAVAFGDFTGEARVGAFVGANRFRDVYGIKDANFPDSPGRAYFLALDDEGTWVDRSGDLFATEADRDTCVNVTSASTADFNNDGKPDVFLSCEGIWYNLPNGENSGTHPKYSQIYLSNQVLFLSTPGKTYQRVDVPYRLRASHASAADIDGDGNVDVALANVSSAPNESGTLVLLGRGDGTFTRSDTLIPRFKANGRRLDWDHGWVHAVHLIPESGRLDVVLTTGQWAVWMQGQPGGFDVWSLQSFQSPISSRANNRYWLSDAIKMGDSFYLVGGAGWDGGHEQVVLKTDFSPAATIIYPATVSMRDNWQPIAWMIKPTVDGALVSYMYGCPSPPRGMCGMRLTENSLKTLSDIDALRYIASHSDLIAAFGDDAVKGRLHFEQWGAREGRRITFDPLIYTASHPDLIMAFGADEEKAARHYINAGFKEQRATALFDPLRYTASHGDIIWRFGFDTTGATRDYIINGYRDGRTTTFDGLAYIASYKDLMDAFATDVVAAIKHYIRYGFDEGRRVTFSALEYIASYADLMVAFGADAVAATKHYITWGYNEGRRVTFSAVSYLANHFDLRSAFGKNTDAAAKHYISFGYSEKRTVERATTTPTTRLDAHRFLVQTTFGPTESDIQGLLETGYGSNGYERWIDDQIAKPISLQLPALAALATQDKQNMGAGIYQNDRVSLWLRNVLRGEDQLRQRVAWALSQIMVVSDVGALFEFPFAIADFNDMLARNAFGNYRKLLEDVTLHPAMGVYLSMLGNQKAVEGTNLRPDENYAREMMQLFSIGLVELNIDGSIRRDANGQPIPTYNQDIIQGFARVFTGWSWACAGNIINAGRTCGINEWRNFDVWPIANFNQARPMQLYPEQHEPGTKQLLVYPGVALSGGRIPAFRGGTRDLKDALDNVFNHPNVGPFISKQLIQKLVTSNPSPDYVRRVSEVFNADTRGVRGNLEEVIKAILLDPEARIRSDSETAGKVKEPLLRLTQLWRAYDAKSPSGKIDLSSFCCPVAGSNPAQIFGQSPGQSPSVFNFFSPFYAPPGEIASAGLVAPELQLANENLNTQMAGFFHAQVNWRTSRQFGQQGQDNLHIDIVEEMKLANNIDALIDHVGEKLLGSRDEISPALRDGIRKQLRMWKIDSTQTDGQNFSRNNHHEGLRQNRVSDALYLMMISPDYAVQR